MLQWHTPPAQSVATYVEKGYDFPVSSNGAPCWNVVNDDGKAVLRKLTGKLASIPDTYSNLLLRYREVNGGTNPDENMTHAELFVRVATLQELRDAAPPKFKFRRYRKPLKRKEYDDCLGYRYDIWSDNNAPITFRDPRNRSGFERLGTQYACCGQPLVHPGCWRGPQLNVYVAYDAVFYFRQRLWYKLLVEQQPNTEMRLLWNADPPPHTHFIVDDNEALKKEIEDLKPSLFNVVMPVLRAYVLQLQSNPNQYVDFELPYIPEAQLFIELHNLYNIKLCSKPDTFETFFMIDDFYASAPNRVMDKFIINPDTWVTAINNIARVKPAPDARYQQLMVTARDFDMQKVNDYLSIKIPPTFFSDLQKQLLRPDSDVEKMRLDPRTFGESYRRGPSPQGIADMENKLNAMQARVDSLPLEQKQKFAAALAYNLQKPITATNLALAKIHNRDAKLIVVIDTINKERKYLQQYNIITGLNGNDTNLKDALKLKKQIEEEVKVAEEEANKGWNKRRDEIDSQWVNLIEMASNDLDIQKLQVDAKALKDNNAIIAKAKEIKAIVDKLAAPYKFDTSKVPFSYKKFIVSEDFAAQKYTTVDVSNELDAFRNAWKKGQDTSVVYSALEQKVLSNLDYDKILAGKKVLEALKILPDSDFLLRYTIGFLENNPIDLTDYQNRLVAKVKELNASDPLKAFETLDQLGLSKFYDSKEKVREELKAAKDENSLIKLAKDRGVLTQQQADELLAVDPAYQQLLEAKKVVLEELRTTGTFTIFPDFAKLKKEADAKIAKYVDEFRNLDWKAIEMKYGVAVPQSLIDIVNVDTLQGEVEKYFRQVSNTNYVPEGYELLYKTLTGKIPERSEVTYKILTNQSIDDARERWIEQTAETMLDALDEAHVASDPEYLNTARVYHTDVLKTRLNIKTATPDRYRAYYNAKLQKHANLINLFENEVQSESFNFRDNLIEFFEESIRVAECKERFKPYFDVLGVANKNGLFVKIYKAIDFDDASMYFGRSLLLNKQLTVDVVKEIWGKKLLSLLRNYDQPIDLKQKRPDFSPQPINRERRPEAFQLTNTLNVPEQSVPQDTLMNKGALKWEDNSCWIDSVFHSLFKLPQTKVEKEIRAAKQLNMFVDTLVFDDGSILKNPRDNVCDGNIYHEFIVNDIVKVQSNPEAQACFSRLQWNRCVSSPVEDVEAQNMPFFVLKSLIDMYALKSLQIQTVDGTFAPKSTCETFVLLDTPVGEDVQIRDAIGDFKLFSVILQRPGHFTTLIHDINNTWFQLNSIGDNRFFTSKTEEEAKSLYQNKVQGERPVAYVYLRDAKPLNEAALYEQGVLSNKVRREAYKNLNEDMLVNGWIAAFDETRKASPAFEKLLAYPWFQEYKENAYVYDAVKTDPNIASAVAAIKVIDESGDWGLVGEWIAESYLSNNKAK